MNGDDIRAFCERNPGIDGTCRHKLLEAAAALDEARERAVPSTLAEVLATTPLSIPQEREVERLVRLGLIDTDLGARMLGKAEAAKGGGETDD